MAWYSQCLRDAQTQTQSRTDRLEYRMPPGPFFNGDESIKIQCNALGHVPARLQTIKFFSSLWSLTSSTTADYLVSYPTAVRLLNAKIVLIRGLAWTATGKLTSFCKLPSRLGAGIHLLIPHSIPRRRQRLGLGARSRRHASCPLASNPGDTTANISLLDFGSELAGLHIHSTYTHTIIRKQKQNSYADW